MQQQQERHLHVSARPRSAASMRGRASDQVLATVPDPAQYRRLSPPPTSASPPPQRPVSSMDRLESYPSAEDVFAAPAQHPAARRPQSAAVVRSAASVGGEVPHVRYEQQYELYQAHSHPLPVQRPEFVEMHQPLVRAGEREPAVPAPAPAAPALDVLNQQIASLMHYEKPRAIPLFAK